MLKRRQLTLNTNARLVLMALGLGLVMAVELMAGNGFLKALLGGTLPWQAAVLVLLMVVVSTGAVVNAFTATMRPEGERIAGMVASCALAMVLGIEASQSVTRLPPYFYFLVCLAGHAAYTWCLVYIMMRFIKINGRWQTVPPHAAAGSVVLVGALAFVGQSFASLETSTLAFALVRDLAAVLAPLAVLVAAAVYRPLRLDAKSFTSSLVLRLPLGDDSDLKRRAFAYTSLGMLGSLGLNLSFRAAGLTGDPTAGFAALTVPSWSWVGIMVLSFAELALFTGEQKQGSVTARLATASARRFVTRHLSERNSWAATTGLKTSSFMIDHDPDGMLHSELPASVMQIRAEEIQRCISDVLGRTYLHNYVIGHRVFGALDPEQSLRTCVDTLRMFACLYLDAGPLVERRIKGLAALLPIVDPGLAKVMRPKDIGALIRRNLWFFHFDFGWIDQRVIHTPRATRYDVNIASLSSRIRQAMMDYLEKTGGVGNFVWIGPEARDRLLQEAPAMAHVIETCPVNADDGKDEMLMFIIKFEHLIPRLQRYFDLDSMRQSLLDFEPSGESTRLLNLLGLQVAKARSPGELMEVLSSVASVPWRGFREKDNALQLILAAFNRLSELVSPGKSLAESTDPAHRPLHDKILDAVRTVGYPSQMLHAAQVAKIALRDVKLLAEVAVDPSSPRFTEAWLIMSTTDYYRHSESNRRAVLELLKSLPDRPRLGKSRLVQAKAVDALASIGRVTRAEEQPLLDEVAARLGVWLPASGADLDVCCLFLDAQLFLASHLKRELKIEPAVVSALDRHIQLLTNELGTADPQVIAIMSRWQEYTGRRAAALSAA